SKKFFNNKDKSGIYFSMGIKKLIVEMGESIREEVELNYNGWVYTKGKYFIDNSEFIEKIDNSYTWKNTITEVNLYDQVVLKTSYEELFDDYKTIHKILRINYDVTWECKVSKNNRFYDIKLGIVRQLDYKFETPNDEEENRY